jgi:hypothetical protein
MKSLLALASFAACCFAQSLTLSLSPSSVQAGQPATLAIAYQDSSPSANVAGIQWQLTLPAGVTAGAPVGGAALTAASKAINCGTSICIAIGDGTALNDSVIASGAIASIPLTVSPSAASGNITAAVLGVTATNPSSVALTVNTITLTVLSPYDLNGDGSVNAADVGIMLNELLTGTCTGQSLKVGDGKCGLIDLETEILAALGLAP